MWIKLAELQEVIRPFSTTKTNHRNIKGVLVTSPKKQYKEAHRAFRVFMKVKNCDAHRTAMIGR